MQEQQHQIKIYGFLQKAVYAVVALDCASLFYMSADIPVVSELLKNFSKLAAIVTDKTALQIVAAFDFYHLTADQIASHHFKAIFFRKIVYDRKFAFFFVDLLHLRGQFAAMNQHNIWNTRRIFYHFLHQVRRLHAASLTMLGHEIVHKNELSSAGADRFRNTRDNKTRERGGI